MSAFWAKRSLCWLLVLQMSGPSADTVRSSAGSNQLITTRMLNLSQPWLWHRVSPSEEKVYPVKYIFSPPQLADLLFSPLRRRKVSLRPLRRCLRYCSVTGHRFDLPRLHANKTSRLRWTLIWIVKSHCEITIIKDTGYICYFNDFKSVWMTPKHLHRGLIKIKL